MKQCFRCSKTYIGKDRILCNDCLKKVKDREVDRNNCLWFYTIKKYKQRFNRDITCSICKETISILAPIVRVGIRMPCYYHVSCYNSLEFNFPLETLNYNLVTSDGRTINTFEIV
jgi:hypothetical protein